MSKLSGRIETPTEGFTVEELGQIVGMSPRNIQGEEGTIDPARPHVTTIALKLQGVGVERPKALQVLGELLDRLGPVAEELIRASSEQVPALVPPTSGGSFDDLNRDTVALTQGIVDLLTEAFRVTLENRGESIIVGLVDRRHGLDFEMDLDPTQFIDHG